MSVLENLSVLIVEDEIKILNSMADSFDGIFKSVYTAKNLSLIHI